MIILDFATLVRNQITAIQALASSVFDFTVGSVIRAIVESNATVTTYLSGLILDLLSATRASTSLATDLDSWMADYGLSRISPSAATGRVTFARFTASTIAHILVGSTVENTDGTQVYTVTADADDVNWDAATGSYLIPINTASITVPVLAVTAGAGANAPAGGINALTQVIQGVDTVTNALAFTTGTDGETDELFRIRFVEYVASLARATMDAIAYAITSIQSGMSYLIIENYDYAGAAKLGFFYVVVDDGSGAPGSLLIEKVTANIDAVRPIGVGFLVYSPVVIAKDVTATITVSGTSGTLVRAAVAKAVTNFMNSFTLGETCPYTMLSQVIYNVSPLITNVTGVTLNGGIADVTATNHQVIKAGVVTIN